MLETSFMEEIFESIDEPILVFSAGDSELLLSNRAAEGLTGSAAGTPGTVKCHHIFCHSPTPCCDSDNPCPVRAVVSSRESARFLRSVRRTDGQEAKVALLASPITGGDGSVDKVVVALRDAMWSGDDTERLARYARQAEERGRLKGLLTEILGHDLLNPASVIRYCSETLSGGERDPRRVMLWGMLKKNLSWLIQIVENTARLTRVESTGEVELRSLDIASVFGDIIENLEPEWQQKGLSVRAPLHGPCMVTANPMLADAFLNVFSNAVRYTPEGGEIGVAIEDGGDRWLVRVSDTGPGIPEECRDRIFDPYERLGQTSGRGKGLGLAIARRIMDLHGGGIRVEDGVGEGAVFCLEIGKSP